MSRNPIIGFPLSLPPDHTLLPLTHDPRPPVLAEYKLVKSGPCTCSTFACVQNLPAKGSSAHSVAHPWLLMAWATFWFLILYGPLPLRAGLCLIVGFSSFSLPFCSFIQSCYHFLPYHSVIPTVMLFDPSLLGLFGPAVYSSLNDSIWSFGLLYYIACGLFCPIYFVLGILGPFAFLRLPWSFF